MVRSLRAGGGKRRSPKYPGRKKHAQEVVDAAGGSANSNSSALYEDGSKNSQRMLKHRFIALLQPVVAAILLLGPMVGVFVLRAAHKRTGELPETFHKHNTTTAAMLRSTTPQTERQPPIGQAATDAAAAARTTSAIAATTTSMEGIPDCPTSPWKPNENLVGACPGVVKPVAGFSSAAECAEGCCSRSECITWQYRRDTGCMMGEDTRLGMEGDGPIAYCHEKAPVPWQGQFLVRQSRGLDQRDKACSTSTWNPNEQPGQCFGLGDLRPPHASASAENCMQACCADEKCGAWQWEANLGCFYGPTMFDCSKSDNPVVFEPFEGRRKIVASRTYTGRDGKPWHQNLHL